MRWPKLKSPPGRNLRHEPRPNARPGYDLFVPSASMQAVAEKLASAARETGGRFCGWQALETARIEAGIPRFGADMDETNLAPEVLDTGRSVTPKAATSARKSSPASAPMAKWPSPCAAFAFPTICPRSRQSRATNYFWATKKSAASPAPPPPRLKTNIALACVRREANQIGDRTPAANSSDKVPAQR